MEWNIGRSGKPWLGPEGQEKLGQLPGRLELVNGKLCSSERERIELLAALLENVGLDTVVCLGGMEQWTQALAARSASTRDSAVYGYSPVPSRHWNCRVIEFANGDDGLWFAIHEVYYDHGQPTSYSESPAAPGWSSNDGQNGGSERLEKFREALSKPVLKVSDFQGTHG